ncbi:alcohol dehydrogenase [Microbulbifer flavimaris]|uniref:Alcohol dehydrogenase n=1 Tax=Microbulbifer flavimaris TaxID=1781068 RepID=A0ABX4HX56_9GAMM|nr:MULTISPECIES: iron-containing alcohol dehydrogenase [Microbulbifer]KUJ82487.1 alcohol dehydrogenase [Microbulbifer sp. ZGT114]PCO04692.1 alcohol dehydrogenase [Microbulbifer flavimaris]
MDTQRFHNNWNYPTAMRVGPGRITDLADTCVALGIRAPLLVTDPGLADLPMVERAMGLCSAAGLKVGLFSSVKGNPNGKNVADGVEALRVGWHDGVIAMGGGSALDAGKAIALMVGQRRPIWDFEDVGDNFLRVDESGMVPVVAVPTTAGTGSEVGRSSVITDEEAQLKRIIFHPKMLPATVILDPELTLGLPSAITAATGMDALSHNLEAFCAPAFHPMAEGIALEGIRLVKEYLPRAVADGSDLEARQQMLVASSMGATAFQRGLGAMHALAHPIGALYDKHHGTINAILMPYVLQANREVIGEPMVRLARYLDLDGSGVDAVLHWVLALREMIGIPNSLGEIDIDSAQAQRVGEMAAVDPSAGSNPIPFDAAAYRDIFSRACSGALNL